MIQFLRRAFRSGVRVVSGGRRSPGIGGALEPAADDERASPGFAAPRLVAIGPDGLPFPPPELHFLVSGNKDLDESAFWTIGRSCADVIVSLLKKHQTDIDELGAMLDFGCGCGRIIRHFHARPKGQVFGTDYNPTLVDWCRRHLPFAEFAVNELRPPLAYRDGQFDFIYAFSVFTHLPESLQGPWLRELSRVLAPGGRVLVTTQGAAYAQEYLPPHERDRFNRGELVVLNRELAGKNECLVYHPAGYVTGALAGDLEVLDFIPGDVMDLSRRLIAQDTYVLEKPTRT
ncbi:MAG TPA: class I SAM-dependent methyltransferase [Candidatus Binatia bacterium]|nr:class I SAM-dependent methyltransferase [Candidatus Binatia bacterium]